MKEVSVENYDRLDGLEVSSEKELASAIEHIETDSVDALAVAGGEFEIGDISVPANPFGILLLLEAIDSPFIVGDDDDDEVAPPAVDIAVAMYVVANGAKAIKPIMALSRRKRAVEKTKALAEKGPEFYQVYLDSIDRLEHEFREVEEKAFEFIDEAGITDLNQAKEFIHELLANMFLAAKAMPAPSGDDGQGEKKTPSE